MTYIRINNLNLPPQDNSTLRFLKKKLAVDVMAFGAVFASHRLHFCRHPTPNVPEMTEKQLNRHLLDGMIEG